MVYSIIILVLCTTIQGVFPRNLIPLSIGTVVNETVNFYCESLEDVFWMFSESRLNTIASYHGSYNENLTLTNVQVFHSGTIECIGTTQNELGRVPFFVSGRLDVFEGQLINQSVPTSKFVPFENQITRQCSTVARQAPISWAAYYSNGASSTINSTHSTFAPTERATIVTESQNGSVLSLVASKLLLKSVECMTVDSNFRLISSRRTVKVYKQNVLDISQTGRMEVEYGAFVNIICTQTAPYTPIHWAINTTSSGLINAHRTTSSLRSIGLEITSPSSLRSVLRFHAEDSSLVSVQCRALEYRSMEPNVNLTSLYTDFVYFIIMRLTQLSLYPHISVMMSRYGTPVTVNCTQSYPTARIIWIGYYKGGTVKLGFPEDNQLASSGVQIVDRGNYFSKLTFGGEDHTLSSVQCQSFNINRNPIFSNRLTIALYGNKSELAGILLHHGEVLDTRVFKGRCFSTNTQVCQATTNAAIWQALCPTLTQPSVGDIIQISNRVGSHAKYRCPNLYELNTNFSIRVCQINGRWSGSEPRCVLQGCPLSPFPDDAIHSVVDQGSFTRTLHGSRVANFNTTVLFVCESNLFLTTSYKCKAPGTLVGDTSKCKQTGSAAAKKDCQNKVYMMQGISMFMLIISSFIEVKTR